MARNSHTHVVYGCRGDEREPAVAGYGKSDRLALADALTKVKALADNSDIRLFYVRSTGDRVPVGVVDQLLGGLWR